MINPLYYKAEVGISEHYISLSQRKGKKKEEGEERNRIIMVLTADTIDQELLVHFHRTLDTSAYDG
jgi:hypothetical protein